MTLNELYRRLEPRMRERYQLLLEEIREEYDRTTNGTDAEEAAPDEGDAAAADEVSDVLVQMIDHQTAELHAIDEAFRRINEGTYGRCEQCGQPIEEDRLEAEPTTTLCIADAVRFERDHRR